MPHKLLIINIAGLNATAVGPLTPNLSRLAETGSGVIPVQPPVPALTSSSQATFLTGSPPAQHGIVSNGWYFRELGLVLNWQRSAHLITGQTLWEAARVKNPNFTCANLFWRYAAHGSSDINVMERPTYWADGRKSPDIYTEPGAIRGELIERHGPFPLFRFWGPAANIESTRWIANATQDLIEQDRFNLLLTYIPHLDYDHQRFGPESLAGRQALTDMDAEVGRLIETAQSRSMQVVVMSDYAFEPVSQAVFPNRALRQAGFLVVQHAENGELLEPGASAAFAVCDQQTAHIYVRDPAVLSRVKQLLEQLDGVERVLDAAQIEAHGLAHPRSGELFVIAESGCWFAYPYWLDESRAPDFARCVAIHAKPGWDPTELFLIPGIKGKIHLAKRLAQKMLGIRAPFDVISGDMSMVGGSHGRIPTDDVHRPMLLTSWPCDVRGVLPMQDLKNLLLEQL